MRKNLFISKSQYIRGLQCYKSLYLYKHQKHLRDETSAAQQAIFASGTDVGVLAQDLFPGGIEVPYDGLSIAEQIKMTEEELAKGTTTIYEASFEFDGLFVKVDILHCGANGWEIYEVKSATSVKPINIHDVALQYYVLAGCEIEISRACLVHINNQYVRSGDIEVENLFSVSDLTEDVTSMQQIVANNIEAMRSALEAGESQIDIGPHCSDPYDCDCRGHCWKHIPENSVFDLRGRGVDKFDYYYRGLIAFEDLALAELNSSQRFQVEMHLTQGEKFDPTGIQKFLDSLWYPLCHFDFETFMSPVPLYDLTRPYQQIPFQYSLHIQREPGGPVEHYEFLAQPHGDPRPDLIKAMVTQIPEDACVLTYNMAFEKTRLKEMMEAFPENAEALGSIHDRVRDLIVPFRKRFIYHWHQHGSNSIKDVLPAFIPELSYKDLEISHGGMAMDAYHLLRLEHDPQKLKSIRHNLLKYCERDTEAMVRLHQKLVDNVE